MSDLISISDYAKAAGISKQAVSKSVDKLVSLGLLTTRRDGRSVMFSRTAFEAAKRGSGDPARELATDMAQGGSAELFARPPADTVAPVAADDPYRAAAADEKIAKARKAQLELQQIEGSLVERDKVINAELTVARAVRNAVLTACGTAADKVVGLPDPKDARAVRAVITTVLKEALTTLADAMPRWKGAEDVTPPGDD